MEDMVTAMDMVKLLVKGTVTNLLLREATNLTTATMVTTPVTLDMVGMEVMELQLMQATETPIITKVTASQLRPLRTNNSLEEKLQAQLKQKTHTSPINYCLA